MNPIDIIKTYMSQGLTPKNVIEKMGISNPIIGNLINMAQNGDNEGKENYNRGNSYNGEDEMIQAVEGIMKNIVEIVRELSEVDSPQVMNVIKKHASRIMDM